MTRQWCSLVLPFALAACSAQGAESKAASVDPQFDWLDYSGNDSVYHTISPGAGDYVNPVLAGFYPDPSITRVGEDFYLVNSTFVYFPGIPVHHSRDLVNWTQIGNVIDRPSQLDFDTLGISRGVFAPSISHHKGTYYVLNTCVDCGGNFYVTATNPAGPWSDPIWLREIDGIDPAFFFDDDGKAYILNNGPPIEKPEYPGHRAIWIQEFDLSTKKLVGPRTVLVNGGVDRSTKPIWIEGPHILRKDGRYILTAAEGGTAEGHSQVVLRSDHVRGPYVPFAGNPILTQRHLGARPFPVTSAGHAELVETPTGEWWATFLATRPYTGDFYNIGRETFLLPVTWVDGWPVILDSTKFVPYVHARPALPASDAPRLPTHGNFSHRDEFSDTSLALHWLQIRTPKERFYDLTSAPGWLTLRARNADITRRGHPSFVGRRQQHLNADVSTAMRYQPAVAGDKAGLLAFQNERFNYLLGVTLEGRSKVVRLERKAGDATPGNAEVMVSAPITTDGSDPIYLRIVARGGLYDFYYGEKPGEWTLLKGDVDGSILSTKIAQGFVGTLLGLYAFTPSK